MQEQMPHLGSAGEGVHKKSAQEKMPHLSNAGKGVHKLGVSEKRPPLSDAGNGVHRITKPPIYDWFAALSARLRRVRVVCGDWTRVCGGNWQPHEGVCGIFFDPPYSDKANRDKNLYAQESLTVAHDVRAWCIERGANEDYRIVLAGYAEEHQELLNHGWRMETWRAHGGYANIGDKQGKINRKREALFISPHCQRGGLFG
jgi:hypothetical protein